MYEVDQMDAVRKVGIQEVSFVERHEGCLDPGLLGSSLSSDYITALSTRKRLINVSQLSNKYHEPEKPIIFKTTCGSSLYSNFILLVFIFSGDF